MNVAYTDTWNSQVSNKDTVYHLGDFTFMNPIPYISKLNGRIKIIPGNHDRWARKQKYQNIQSKAGPVEILPLIHVLTIRKHLIVLCHYPMYSWPHSYHGSWHLYGHSHGELNFSLLAMNVGVDNNNGRLYSLDDVTDTLY